MSDHAIFDAFSMVETVERNSVNKLYSEKMEISQGNTDIVNRKYQDIA